MRQRLGGGNWSGAAFSFSRYSAMCIVPSLVVAISIDGLAIKIAALVLPFLFAALDVGVSGLRLKRSFLFSASTAWILITGISLARAPTALLSGALYSLGYLFLLWLLLAFLYSRPAKRLLYDIWLGASTLVVVNAILLVLGLSRSLRYINDADYGTAVLLGFLGIDVNRTLPLLAPGFQSYSVLLGVVLFFAWWPPSSTVAEAGTHLARARTSFFRLIVALAAVAQLLITDARGAILYICLAAMIVTFLRAFRGKGGKAFVISFLGLAFLIGPILYEVNESETFSELTRGSANLLSGRDRIWEPAVAYLQDNIGQTIFGLGYAGHKTAGVMDVYLDLFGKWDLTETSVITLHNSWLQLIFDVGFVGFLLTIILLIRVCLSSLSESFFLASVFFLVLYAATDVMFSPYNILGVAIFFFISVGLIARKRSDGDGIR